MVRHVARSLKIILALVAIAALMGASADYRGGTYKGATYKTGAGGYPRNATVEASPPPDTTAPVLSSPSYACDMTGLWQGGGAVSDEDCIYQYRIGYGTKLSTIVLGAWSAYSSTFDTTPGGWFNTSHQMTPGEYFKFEIRAKDAAGNVSNVVSSYFMSINGDCP